MAETDTQQEAVLLSEGDVLNLLRDACDAAGSQSAWARQQGMTGSYVCEVLRGRRGLTDRMLRALGLQQAEPLYVTRRPETVELYGADGEVLVRAERVFS